MGRVQFGIVALLFHINVFGANALVLTTEGRDLEAQPSARSAPLPFSAASLRVQQRQTPEGETSDDTEKTLMEKINTIGRDLCKERPNHPKCQQFKEKPTEAPQEKPSPSPKEEPTPAPKEEKVSDINEFGTGVAAPPAPAPAPQTTEPPAVDKPFGSLDRWGKASRTNPTELPPVELAPGETLPPTAPPTVEPVPAKTNEAPPAKGTEINEWGKGKEESPTKAPVKPTEAPAQPEVAPTEAPATPTEAPAKPEVNAEAEAAARQQAVADIASSRPAQSPKRETPSEPTQPPRKITPEQAAAKLP